ncbi:hypothetical protein FJZ33_06170, partial [Candidatus Poribacteria bacterium]|nr:hypothetical protein [Candidatus Poribacteria bacterium]
MKFYFESIILCIVFAILGYSSAIAQTYGDVNGDGLINSDDIRLVLHNSVGPADRIMELTPEQIKMADVDGDGQITPYDAGLILKRSLASNFVFPVEGGIGIMSSGIAANPISISIPIVEGAPGSEILAPIITGDVGGAEIITIIITLECDKDILTPLGIVSAGTLTAQWCSDFPDNCYYEVNVRKDRIYIGMIGLGLSGGGTLVKVKYKVSDFVNPGNESPINFLDFQYNLGDPPTVTTNGKFKAILPSSYILITAPNGGEKIKGGGPYDITWNKAGIGINRLQLLY